MKVRKLLCPLLLCGALVLARAAAQAPAAAPSIPQEPRGKDFNSAPQCADHRSFHSAALAREMSYCVILPSNYADGKGQYAVLYLLHGLYGSENDWLARTKIGAYAQGLPLIVVMPEADDSWYTNSFADSRNRYEDYLFGDLVHEIEAKFRTKPARDARFIAGLSMGGYGALKAGLRHPEMFAMAGSFSGALYASRYAPERVTTGLAFGPLNSPTRPGNNIYTLLAKADYSKLPYFFVTCGSDDRLLSDSRQFTGMMAALGVGYEYHESVAAHSWEFWDRSILAFLRALGDRYFALKG